MLIWTVGGGGGGDGLEKSRCKLQCVGCQLNIVIYRNALTRGITEFPSLLQIGHLRQLAGPVIL